MSIHTRIAQLDGNGTGGIEAPTAWYCGCIDAGSAIALTNQSFGLSRGPQKRSDAVPVAGSIHITGGAPNQAVPVFFDF